MLDTVTIYTKQCYPHKMFSTKADIAIPAVISSPTLLLPVEIYDRMRFPSYTQ